MQEKPPVLPLDYFEKKPPVLPLDHFDKKPKEQGGFLTKALNRMTAKLPPGFANPEKQGPKSPAQLQLEKFTAEKNLRAKPQPKFTVGQESIPDQLARADRMAQRITKATSSLNIPIPFTDRYLPTGDIVGAIANQPFDMATDTNVLQHPDATLEQRARAGVNLALNAGGDAVVVSTIGKYVAKPIYNKVKQLLTKGKRAEAEKVMAQGLKEAPDVDATPISEAIPGYRPKEKPQNTPKVENEGEPQGLSRASRAVHADVYGTNKPVSIGGKSLDELYEGGKKKLDEGFDADDEMAELAKAGRPATDEQIGIFAAHRDSLLTDLKKLNAKLDKGDTGALAERDALFERIADFDRNLDEVKGAGGRSLNALKIGHTVNFADLDEVLLEAQRVKGSQVSSGTVKQFRELTEQQAKAEGRIAVLEQDLATAKAEGTFATHRPKKGARFDKESLDKELSELFEEGKKKLASTNLGAGLGGLDPELFAIAGKIAVNYAKRGVNSLDEIVANVQEVWKAQFGQEIDRQTVIDAMGSPQGASRTKSELEKQIGSLRAQAKREGTANKTKIEADIAEAKRQLDKGYYRVPSPKELQVSKELQALKDTKALYEQKTRNALERLQRPQPNLAVKTAKEVSGLGKIVTLGSDFGAVLRQGIFGITNPKAYGKALANAKQALKSEASLVRLERESLEVKYPDGKLAEKVRRKSGLSRSSVGDPEEGYLIGMLDKILGGTIGKIPGLKNVGGALGRGQSALLNKLRNEMFDDFYIRHGGDATEQELKDWANYLNSALGRSSSYGAKKTPSELAQIVLTSPRYEASRWEMVGNYLSSPATAIKAFSDKAARAKIINMAATGATVLGTLKLTAYATDSELVADPESSDFLKLRMGDKVVDLTAGISPRLRGVIRAYLFFKDPEAKTQYTKATGEPYKRNETLAKEILSGVTRPVSPALTGTVEERTGYSLSGWREEEGDPQGWERLMPLIAQGFKQDFEKGGYGEAFKNVGIEFFGGSVQRYPAKQGK